MFINFFMALYFLVFLYWLDANLAKKLTINHHLLDSFILGAVFGAASSILGARIAVTATVAAQHAITSTKKPVYPRLCCSHPAKNPGIIILRAMNAVHIA